MATSASYIDLNEGVAPATPSVGKVRVYAKVDGNTYQKDDVGAETGLAAASGSLTDHTHAVTGSGATGGGATLDPGTLNATGLARLSGGITSAVDADQNNFAPTSIHAVTSIRFTSFTAARTITGIDAGAGGEVLILQNNTSFSLLLPNESASSLAANRFRTPDFVTYTVRRAGSVLLVSLGGRWCVIAA